jgi:hypothetical protein
MLGNKTFLDELSKSKFALPLPSPFTAQHRLAMCRNAPNPLGPVNCTSHLLRIGRLHEPNLKLIADELIELCHHANSGGPAECFVEGHNIFPTTIPAKPLSKEAQARPNPLAPEAPKISSTLISSLTTANGHRAHLCNSAENPGPAHCYRLAEAVFKRDIENSYLLCVGSRSEGPAACAAEGNITLSS